MTTGRQPGGILNLTWVWLFWDCNCRLGELGFGGIKFGLLVRILGLKNSGLSDKSLGVILASKIKLQSCKIGVTGWGELVWFRIVGSSVRGGEGWG